MRTGSQSGTVKGRLTIEPTYGEWVYLDYALTEPITGIQDLFFILSGPTSSQFKFDNWQFSESATGISNVSVERPSNQEIYDLQGRKLSFTTKLKPGIYIIDGKKTVIL